MVPKFNHIKMFRSSEMPSNVRVSLRAWVDGQYEMDSEIPVALIHVSGPEDFDFDQIHDVWLISNRCNPHEDIVVYFDQ